MVGPMNKVERSHLEKRIKGSTLGFLHSLENLVQIPDSAGVVSVMDCARELEPLNVDTVSNLALC